MTESFEKYIFCPFYSKLECSSFDVTFAVFYNAHISVHYKFKRFIQIDGMDKCFLKSSWNTSREDISTMVNIGFLAKNLIWRMAKIPFLMGFKFEGFLIFSFLLGKIWRSYLFNFSWNLISQKSTKIYFSWGKHYCLFEICINEISNSDICCFIKWTPQVHFHILIFLWVIVFKCRYFIPIDADLTNIIFNSFLDVVLSKYWSMIPCLVNLWFWEHSVDHW